MEVIYYSRDFPGAMALYDAFYIDRRIGSYEVTPLVFTSTDGKIKILVWSKGDATQQHRNSGSIHLRQ